MPILILQDFHTSRGDILDQNAPSWCDKLVDFAKRVRQKFQTDCHGTKHQIQGWTWNEKMGYAKSIMDYLGRWMQHRFIEREQLDLFALPASAPSSVTQSVA